MNKLTVRDIDVRDKRILVRVDYNVPLNYKTGAITNDSRIRASLPTIDYLLEHGSKIILCSHLGRPAGKPSEEFSLAIVADRLSRILRQTVGFVKDCIGPEVDKAIGDMKNGDILLLENLRFHKEEEEGDDAFAQALSKHGDIFVDDAFGTAHRKHASIVGVTKYMPAVAGLLLEKEIKALGKVLTEPPHPFGVLLGGAKVSDKVGMLNNIMGKVDTIVIGGGMAATFLKAQSYEVGASLIDDSIDAAAEIIEKAKKNGVKLVLPDDVLVTNEINDKGATENVDIANIPPDKHIVDIGTLTITKFTKALEKCRTLFWNGPMGIYEIPQFSEGTKTIAKIIASMHRTTIIGGGSTSEIVTEMKLCDKMTFVSTGGGASLKFLSGKALPGVEALLDRNAKVN